MGPQQRLSAVFQSPQTRRFHARSGRAQRTRKIRAKGAFSITDSSGIKKRSPFKWLARLGVGIALLALLLSQREVAAQFWTTVKSVSPLVWGGAVAFYLLGQALSAWKWQLLLRARDCDVSWSDCFRFYLAGMFGNLWLPTNIGGDALRVALLKNRAPDIGVAGAAASVLVERLTGFAALLVLALGALVGRAFSGSSLSARETQLLLGVGALFGVAIVGWQVSKRFKHPKIAALHEAMAFYGTRERRGALWVALVLSFVFQASQVVLNWGLARAVGLDVPFAAFWWLGPLLSLASLLPLSIGGLGVREGAALALMASFHVAAGEVVAWSLLWQATTWAASLPGVLFVRNSSSRT